MVREFVRGLQDLCVRTHDGQPVVLEHPDKATWIVRLDAPTAVVVRYTVYGHELTVRTAHIDTTHAFFNGANVCLRVESQAHLAQHVRIDAPDGWTAFVSLPDVEGTFAASDYVHLADTVFEIGPHPCHVFDVDGVAHRMIFWGAEGLLHNIAQLEEDTRALILQNSDTFASPLPYTRYDFVFHVTPTARGGLEHRDSTTLATPWAYFETADGYLDMLTLIAHEHFHAYNGRRLTPSSLATIDFSAENYTQELWVIEGFTSHFDELNTHRAGRMTRAQWLARTAKALTQLHGVFGRTRQSLTEASHDAWVRLYRPHAHTRNQTVSYYLKGSLVALAIDLSMRAATDGARGLDDVMQQLWSDWHHRGQSYTTASVLTIIGALSSDAVSTDAQRWVTTTEEPPYRALLEAAGVVWEETPTPDDGGVVWETSGAHPVVHSIDEARAEAVGGFLPSDEVLAVNGRRVTSGDVKARWTALQEHAGDAEHEAHVFRLGRMTTVRFRLQPSTTIHLRDANPILTTGLFPL